LRCAKTELSGVWNVTGEPQPFSDVITEIIAATGSNADAVWVSEKAILGAELTPWIDVPMMAPALPSFRHFMEVSTDKAQAAGLKCRPLGETLVPLIEWDRSRRSVP
jgi:2'-hydroxyisoflavone reductase